jgi:plasmid replication initiation protein
LLPRHQHDQDIETLGFVAETSVRRLLNRIHNSLYSATSDSDRSNIKLEALYTVAGELKRQLDQWYFSIPPFIQAPLGLESVEHDRSRILRIRYYAAMHIIHRPFVLYIAEHRSKDFSKNHTILMLAETCITSIRVYLLNASEMLKKRTPYLWTFSIS